MKNHVIRVIALAFAFSLVVMQGRGLALGATPVATPLAVELGPVLPQYDDEFGAALETIPRYEMVLTLDALQSTIGGSMTVTYPNVTGQTQTTLPFRLYPNASYYGEGGTAIEDIAVEGESIAPRFDDSGTVLFVDLPEPLSPEDSVTISIDFTTAVPINADGSFGILNNDVAARRFVLADWYPVIAGWDERGWRLEAPTEQGDPTFAATSVYQVRLVVPDGFDVVATGVETRQKDGSVQIETAPVRELAIVAAQGQETISETAGGTVISVHVSADHRASGQHMLDTAVAALEFYDASFGTYPFDELDIVETDLSLAYGVSWSGILFINQSQLMPGNETTLDFTVFHEVGHQWWGATVGANSNDHTYMVEGLTNASAFLAQADAQGSQAAINSLYAWMVTPYLNLLTNSGDAVVDVSIFDQPATAPISTLAYGKGGLGFLAIWNEIGNDAFIEGLAAFAEQFRLGIAEPADLLAAFEAASGRDLQALWSFWFDESNTTPADVEALVSEIVATLG